MYRTPNNWQLAIDKSVPPPEVMEIRQTDLVILGCLRVLTMQKGLATLDDLQEAIGHPTLAAEMETTIRRLSYLGLIEYATVGDHNV